MRSQIAPKNSLLSLMSNQQVHFGREGYGIISEELPGLIFLKMNFLRIL